MKRWQLGADLERVHSAPFKEVVNLAWAFRV